MSCYNREHRQLETEVDDYEWSPYLQKIELESTSRGEFINLKIKVHSYSWQVAEDVKEAVEKVLLNVREGDGPSDDKQVQKEVIKELRGENKYLYDELKKYYAEEERKDIEEMMAERERKDKEFDESREDDSSSEETSES